MKNLILTIKMRDNMIKGIGASQGIAIGKALLLHEEAMKIERYQIEDVKLHQDQILLAFEKSRLQLREIQESCGKVQKEILEAHIMILEDTEFICGITDKIKHEKLNAQAALDDTIKYFINIFEKMDNEYMRERAADVMDVGKRIMMNLMEKELPDLMNLSQPVIIVAHDITPSDTAQMKKEMVLGFITDIGGRTSHSAIMARSMDIPAVLGLTDITKRVKLGDTIAFDGEKGIVEINPDEETLRAYSEKSLQLWNLKKELAQLKGDQSMTSDGHHVEIGCNIGNPKDALKADECGAEGIGLFRTEFLYMERSSLPTEDEQYEAYASVLKTMGQRPVVIRTLDIGADKQLPYMEIEKEMNPCLGFRAIRLCLANSEIFKTQLRALLRASIHGNLKIMYPMISSVEEVREANEVLEECKAELINEMKQYSSSVEVGIMIEIPAAAIISDLLAEEVDFFSIGTNDLLQYTTATDRMNHKVEYLHNPFHPAVLRLINQVIQNGHKKGILVGMCGEAAGDKRLIPLFIGMGLDKFSMSSGSMMAVKKQIKSLSRKDMKEMVDKALDMKTAKEIEDFVERF